MSQQVTCYKASMAVTRDPDAPKKVEMIGVKVGAPDKEKLLEICYKHDRPLGYVVRELMLRGLAAYMRDGKMKEPAEAGNLRKFGKGK